MRKNNFFLLAVFIGITLLASFVIPTSATSTSIQGAYTPPGNKIAISVASSGNALNVTQININVSIDYSVTFVNTQSIALELVILKPGIGLTDINASNPASTNISQQFGPIYGPKTSTGTDWYSPSTDSWVGFYCFQPGNYKSGMQGIFKVGNPTGSLPAGFTTGNNAGTSSGFEFLIVLLGIGGLVAFRARRTNH